MPLRRPGRRLALLASLAWTLSSLALAAQAAGGAAAGAAPAGPGLPQSLAGQAAVSYWTIGISRFVVEGGGSASTLQDTIPRLMAEALRSLPARKTPDEELSEVAARDALRARFALGADLASKLDSRAAKYFDPSLDSAAVKDSLASIDKQIALSAQGLAALDAAKAPGSPRQGPLALAQKPSRLWEGHAKGLLIDAPTSTLSSAGKSAGVDLLVTGSVALLDDGYAAVRVSGYDLSLDREAFGWKSYCSVDDPGPLASDMASRIESWTAGRPFARIELHTDPPSAELKANGLDLEGSRPVIYSYEAGSLSVEASAPGFAPKTETVEAALGDRKVLDISLEPLSTGTARLSVDPPGAAVSLDSVPIGLAPLTIKLDGSRGIAVASAKGRESSTLVLPASGESDIGISLLPSDGLGPTGRLGAARDRFYQSLGWFALTIPATALTYAAMSGYDDAYARSPSPSLYVSRNVSIGALGASALAMGATAGIAIFRLVKYLGTAH
jgi:hypothetical protein